MSYSRVVYPRTSAVQRQQRGQRRTWREDRDREPSRPEVEVPSRNRPVPVPGTGRPEAGRLHYRDVQGHRGYGGEEGERGALGDPEEGGLQGGAPGWRQQQEERTVQKYV